MTSVTASSKTGPLLMPTLACLSFWDSKYLLMVFVEDFGTISSEGYMKPSSVLGGGGGC